MMTIETEEKVPVKLRLKRFRRKITYSNVFIQFVANLGFVLIKLYTITLRIQVIWHPESEYLDKSKILYGFWHGRQFLLVPSFAHQNVAIMSDVSWAGEIQTRILEKFGYFMVRGSSKRKGVRALLDMKRAMSFGKTPAFALDGPRGPIYEAKPGIVFLAKKMKHAILPMATTAKKHWIFKSTWCLYQFPKPFSQCLVQIGAPIWCHEMEDTEALEKVNHALKSLMQDTDLKVK